MSVSLADTFDREPEHIVAKDPTEVVRKFWEALVRRGEVLRERIRQEYMPEDFELLPKKQQAIIREWCNQIPVLQQQYPVRGGSASNERIFVADRTNRIPKPKQTFRAAFRGKDFALCPAVRMVSRPRPQNHSSVSHHRL